ncbi:flippase [bacterium]|nr:flippase [candidate division CSSED10-310 bacterium]
MVAVPRSLIPAESGNRHNSLFGRIARNSVVVLVSKIIDITAALAIMMLLTRLLTTSRFGDFAFINAVVLAFQPLINLELNTLLIREMASNRSREAILLGGGLLLKIILIGGFITAAVILDGIMQFQPVIRICFYLAIAAEVFQQITWVYSAVFMARERMEFEPMLSLISRGIAVGGIILLMLVCPRHLFWSTGLILIFCVLAAAQFARGIAGILVVRRFLDGFHIDWSPAVARDLFRHSWIMGIATFCTCLTLRIDVYFLKYFHGSETVAIFHLPHMYTLQIQILAVSIVTALFPVLSRWAGDAIDHQRFKRMQDFSIRVITLFGLGIALFTVFFPRWIVQVLGGSTYLPSTAALVILAWCIPILFLNYLCTNLLITLKKQELLIYGAVISLLINASLDMLWIPDHGIVGASFATVIAYTSQLVVVLILLRIVTRSTLDLGRVIGLPWAICLISAGMARWTEQWVEANAVTGIVIRLTLLIAVGLLLLAIQPKAIRIALIQSRRRVSLDWASGVGQSYGVGDSSSESVSKDDRFGSGTPDAKTPFSS